jgi:hypothetical protein
MIKRMLVIMLLIGLVLGIAPAAAHEGREVGDYLIEFGWRMEPAYTELLNGPELTVVTHDSEQPVEGLEDTLKLEVLFGSQSKALRLRALPDNPGHYTADLIPTRPGDYSFRLTGTIGDVTVDETFSSADGEFSTVEPVSDIRFP